MALPEIKIQFRQADAIFQQPHHQEASADELQTPSADFLPTEQTER